jgi:hypothetical protein
MQACKLIMFYYACTHVRSRVWSGSAAKGVLRKRAQIGAPVRKGTLIIHLLNYKIVNLKFLLKLLLRCHLLDIIVISLSLVEVYNYHHKRSLIIFWTAHVRADHN